MPTRENVQAVIDGILAGKLLETFDTYYGDDIIMSENGADERIGKEVNRAYEQAFVDSVSFHGVEVGLVIVDGDHAAIEWAFDLTPAGGERTIQRQMSVQTWRDNRIVREVFYHG